MSNFVYQLACGSILNQDIDLVNDDIRIALVSAAYTPNLVSDQFVDDLGAAIVARSGALSGKSVSASGVFDADDVTVSAVSGDPVTQLVGFKHTGDDTTARLIWLMDTGTGLPFTPSGGNVPITWNDGADKIFALVQPA